MRKAYIGLSSPTAYFYDSDQSHFKEQWQWNPILESPQGLITLFDELWFLTRAVCPANLRSESYVKFLDEDSAYIPLIKGVSKLFYEERLDGILTKYPYLVDAIDIPPHFPGEQFKSYREVIDAVYGKEPDSNNPIDNHSHGIDICGYQLWGNSLSIDHFAFDAAIISNMGANNIEFITNRFNTELFKGKARTLGNLQVSQGVTIKRIPVLQTPAGPVLHRIEAIRENKYLVDFRNKIISTEHLENLTDLVDSIEAEFNKYRNDLLLKKQRGTNLLSSIGKNALSFLGGLVIPAVGEIKSLKEDYQASKMNWTGFISKIENSA